MDALLTTAHGNGMTDWTVGPVRRILYNGDPAAMNYAGGVWFEKGIAVIPMDGRQATARPVNLPDGRQEFALEISPASTIAGEPDGEPCHHTGCGTVCGSPAAHAAHNCEENAVPYKSDGALGHGWECGICGRFLQAG